MKSRFFAMGTVFLALCGSANGSPGQANDSITNIALIAGPKSHGPEGNRIHDYPWSVRLLQASLESSEIAEKIRVSTYFEGWPTDPEALDQTDTIMIVSDGRDGPNGREALHLESPERVAQVQELVDRGCGIVTFHFSTFAPDALGDRALDWYGGYFDWETNGRRNWYSAIDTLESSVVPASPDHPILSGVSPFKMREEFYYNMRFAPNDPQWTPILRATSIETDRKNGNVVAWAVERDSGARGFATTCGHYYDNWKHDGFRKTVLNAIAWTAGLEIPDEGLAVPFLDRNQIAEHLDLPDLIAESKFEASEEAYAGEPYWYQPGHPIQPSEPIDLQVPEGFMVERVFDVPESWGSWTALTIDDQGRLITAAQHKPGLYRIDLTGDNGQPEVEKLSGVASEFGWAHGLLYAFDSLYVTVSEANDTTPTGVYRLADTDHDGQFDQTTLIVELDASGEHGAHDLVPGPDGASIYFICGNGTPLPDKVETRLPARPEGVDRLCPPGFESSTHTDAGWVARFDPNGANWRLIASGLRNAYDLAFNHHGELFTYDSDMEWDLGAPWYRPTRICHVTPGAEFGWRPDAAKWPEYYEDTPAPVVNIGPASPTGITFGYGTKFPERYQRALYACDWTFATVYAVHMEPKGASYTATVEPFLGGAGFPVTDVVVGQDGALYFTVGGRRLGSALYRVRYIGEEPSSPVTFDAASDKSTATPKLRALRRKLETANAQDSIVWDNLDHGDRAIRYAARNALERHTIQNWIQKAFDKLENDGSLNAGLAIARSAKSPATLRRALKAIQRIDVKNLSEPRALAALRIHEWLIAKLPELTAEERATIQAHLRPLFPNDSKWVNRETARLLAYLEDTSIIDPLLELMVADTGSVSEIQSIVADRNAKYGIAIRDILQSAPMVDRMSYAHSALWLEDGWSDRQRLDFFKLMDAAPRESRGGHMYGEIWERIREIALDQTDPDLYDQIAEFANLYQTETPSDLPDPIGPGQEWTLEAVMDLVQDGLQDRDFEAGKTAYAAARCVQCHQFNGEGAPIGPDLNSIGQRFTIKDIVDATIHPNKAVSDQYRLAVVKTHDGEIVSGRVFSRDNEAIRIGTNLLRPGEYRELPLADVKSVQTAPISTMPPGALNPLNGDEILDLLAYLVSGGRPNHPLFER